MYRCSKCGTVTHLTMRTDQGELCLSCIREGYPDVFRYLYNWTHDHPDARQQLQTTAVEIQAACGAKLRPGMGMIGYVFDSPRYGARLGFVLNADRGDVLLAIADLMERYGLSLDGLATQFKMEASMK